MRLNTRGNEKATVVGGKSLGTYRINANKAAFETLSSRLYSDKIRAVIRELSCNAIDAHVAANKAEVPFEVHLPTTFEPWFEIKDFGTGLSHINIVDLFCTYFGTNKSDSDQFIGALGLGSKSPFCLTMRDSKTGREEAQGFSITDRFRGDSGVCPVCNKIVLLVDEWMRDPKRQHLVRKPNEDEVGRISTKTAFDPVDTDEFDTHVDCTGVGLLPLNVRENGGSEDPVFRPLIVRNYDAMIEEGEPKLTLMAESIVAEEPVGITVRFDVQQEQIWEFENKAKIALEFFHPRPTFNVEDFDVPTVQYSVKTALWGMRKEARTPQTHTVRAIQGKVQYNVGHIDISRTSDWQKKLLDMPIDLFFPIGSLDPAVSRETLELNERTINNILAMLDSVYEEMLAEVKKQIDECPQPWMARMLVWELSHAEGVGKLVNDAWNTGALFGKYKNFVLDFKKPFLNDLDMEQTMLIRYSRRTKGDQVDGEVGKRGKKAYMTQVVDPFRRTQILNDIMNGRVVKSEFNREIEVESKVGFIINDTKMGGDKFMHFILQNADEEEQKALGLDCKKTVLYVLQRVSKSSDPKDVVKEAKKLLKRIGNPPFLLVSHLKAILQPKIERYRNDNPSIPRERRTIVELNRNHTSGRGRGWRDAWEKSEEQPDGKKFYVALERLKATETGFYRAYELVEFINTCSATGLLGIDEHTVIYGLRKNSPLRQNPEWVEVVSHLKKLIPSMMTPEREMQMSYLFKSFSCDHNSLLQKIADKKLLYAKSPLQKFANALAAAKAAPTGADRAVKKALAYVNYTATNTVTFDEQWKEMQKRYPILYLNFYGGHRMPNNLSEERVIVDYLLMLDEKDGITAPAKALAAAAGDGLVIAPSELTVSETEVSNV